MKYIGILDGSGDVWGVRNPDLLGAYGGGATPEEAIADATSALREMAAHMASKGQSLPRPRKLAELLADEDAAPDGASGERAITISFSRSGDENPGRSPARRGSRMT